MYALRYFAPRYFTPVYFPETGKNPGDVRLRIGQLDASNYLYYGAPIRWNLLRGARGTATLPLIVEPDDTFGPQVGEPIEIYDPVRVRVWSGTVEAIGISWIGDDGWHLITLTCVSLEQLYDTAVLDKVEYTAPMTCGDVVAALHTLSGVTDVTLGTIDDGPIVQSLQVSNVAQGFNDLCTLAGFNWYVDPLDNTLNFHAPDARAADWELGSTDVLWETLDYQQSRVDYRDKQLEQLPGVAQSPITASFEGDATTTVFPLPSVPAFIVSKDMTVNGISVSFNDFTLTWLPGNDFVTLIPAMLTGVTLTIVYAEVSGQSSGNAVAASPGIGSKTARNTKTRTFTPAGGLQETEAILARYSMLPSTLQLSTDKPGIGIARALTVALAYPISASTVLNGIWMVMEVEASVIPGLDMRDEPWGHFRYTLHMVNTAATAIFRGDGSTTIFVLPEIPASVPSIRVTNTTGPVVANWIISTANISVTPAIGPDSTVAVDYRGAERPDVPTFVSTWEDMPGGQQDNAGPAPDALNNPILRTEIFHRTLTIFDTAVADDIAPHTPVYHDGIGLRLLGVLRKIITADLTVRINKTREPHDLTLDELITVTIPSGTIPDEVLEWSLAAGSPASLPSFLDKEVLTADILESDGSTDEDGIAQFTVEWTFTS